MENDPTVKDWLKVALDMTFSRKRTKRVAHVCDKFNYAPVRRIKVSKDKEDYLNLALKFELAVKEVLAGADDSLVAESFELDLETLRQEIIRFQNSTADLYEFNVTGGVFSYREELMLLEVLATIPRSNCKCQACTLILLPFLAYRVARQKGKSPQEWNLYQHANEAWLANFKIEYEYEISNSFLKHCNCQCSMSGQEKCTIEIYKKILQKSGEFVTLTHGN